MQTGVFCVSAQMESSPQASPGWVQRSSGARFSAMGAQWPISAFQALKRQVSPVAQRFAEESASKGSHEGMQTGTNPGPPKYGEARVEVKSVCTERGKRHSLPAAQSLPWQVWPGWRGPAAAQKGCSW